MKTHTRSHDTLRQSLAALLMLAVCPDGIGASQAVIRQDANQVGAMNRGGATVKTFVIIFRQSPGALSEADLKRRGEETIVWAQRHNGAGHKLDPRILAADGVRSRAGGNAPVASGDAWPVTALLFLEANDLNEAAQIAQAHPAVRYGAEVEVRAWASPVAPPSQQTSPGSR